MSIAIVVSFLGGVFSPSQELWLARVTGREGAPVTMPLSPSRVHLVFTFDLC